MMKIIKLTKNNLNQAIAALKQGHLVIYPTETCYGLAVDATNSRAVTKLLTYKGNRSNKPISIACADQKMAAKYVRLNDTARHLYKNFLPGPLTVVSQSRAQTAPALEAGGNTLGVRIPDYPLILQLIKDFDRPITATSANTSGQKQPYSLQDWQRYTSVKKQAMIEFFLDAGRLDQREPSTVVDTTLNETKILRQGEIKIPAAAGHVFTSHSEEETQKIAQKILSQSQHLGGVLRTPSKESLRAKCLLRGGRMPSSDGGTKRCLIFALQGELGSGKTQFAKGLAKGLNIKANITSPTYTIIHEYPYKKGIFYHIDTWRLNKGEELLDLGLKQMIKPDNIIAIEWLQKVKGILEKLSDSSDGGPERSRMDSRKGTRSPRDFSSSEVLRDKPKIIWLTIETLSPTKRRIKYQFKSKPSLVRRGIK